MLLANVAYLAPPVVAFVVNLVLLVLVIRAPVKTLLYYVFGLFLASMGLWAFFIFGMRSSSTPEMALRWERLVFVVFPLIAISYIHFVLLLTRRIGPLRQALPLYGLLVVLGALGPSPLVLQGMVLRPYGWAPVGGPLFIPWMVFQQAIVLVGLILLFRSYLRAEAAEERNRYLYLVLGALCALLGATSDYLAAVGLLAYPLGIIGNLAFGIITAMAVMLHRLMDLQVVLQRGVIYATFSATVATIYVLILLAVNRFLAQQGGFSFAVQVLLIFVLALAVQPAVRFLQELADRWLYGQRYDYLRLLRSFAATSQSLMDLPVLVQGLTRTIQLAMHTRGVWLLLPTPRGDFAPAVGEGPVLGANSPIVRWLRREGRPLWRQRLSVIPALQAVSEGEREALHRWDVRLLIPLRTPRGLAGILALGPRETGERYSQAEMDVLVTVAQQVAIALENARLFAMEREQVRHLRELDRMKTDFLGMVSHQLKTPITSLKAALGLLQDTEPQQGPVRERLLTNMDRSVTALERLVSDLLEFAKVRSGQISMEREQVVLQELVQDTVNLLTPSIQANEQRLVLELPREPILVMADRHRLSQVLVNLLSNAAKFTPVKGEIRVRAWQEDGQALVSVTDSCGGIPEADHPYLFEAYRRSSKDSPDTAAPGTGLGLSIAKGLVELHKGRIWFTNHPGRGCTFTIAIPLTPPAEEEEAPAQAGQEAGG